MTARELPRPRNWQDFEDLCCDLFRELWQAPLAQKHGRQGQPQAGVDVFGMPGGGPEWAGAQCKKLSSGPLTEEMLRSEVEKAKAFQPPLTSFVLATTAPRDGKAQRWARELSGASTFSVTVFAWDDICEALDGREELLRKHFRDAFPPDPGDLRQHYLRHLWDVLNVVPISKVGRTAQEDRDLELSSVYVDLDVEARIRFRGALVAEGGKIELRDSTVEDALSGDWDARWSLRRRYDLKVSTQILAAAESGPAAQANPETRHASRRCTALEAMATSLRRVLTGRGGSGKSTFGRYLCLCMAGEALGRSEADLARLNAGCENLDRRLHTWPHGPKLPFFVELRRFVQSRHFPKPGHDGEASHLVAYLAGLGPAGVDLGPLLLHALGENSGARVLLVLDGLDEVPDAAAAGDRLKQVISRFVRVYPACRVLLTSRPYAYAPGQEWRLDEAGFEAEALAPFDEEKIQRFVRDAYTSFAARHRVDADRAEELAADLLEQLETNRSLQPLAEQPLMLTMMADLHSQKVGRLPGGPAALFEESVVLLFDRWNERRGHTTAAELAGMDEEQIRDALELLAFRAHRDGGEGTDQAADIEEDALVLALHDTRKRYGLKESYSPEEIRDHLNQRSGILIAESPTVYRFPHRFFQEYLAACHLDRRYPRHLEDCLAAEGQLWREVLLFLAARASHTDRIWHLLRQMVPAAPPEDLEADDLRFVPLLYAALAILEHRLWERRELDQPSPFEDIRLWLRRAVELGALEPGGRARLGRALGWLGDDRPGVALRPDGLPDIQWVEIPAGTFWMGGEDESEGGRRHEVTLSAFEIARHPVTNAQYQAFVDDGGYTEARRECWSEEGWAWKKDREGPDDDIPEVFRLPNHPRVEISWFEAEAFCRWLGQRLGQEIRLPTEAQWERSVRGTDGRVYPWGDEFETSLCNAASTGIGSTTAVGLFPGGESPQGRNGIGLLDGAGNIYEWCLDRESGGGYPEGPRTAPSGPAEGPFRVFRGGSWCDLARRVRAAYRFWSAPGYRIDDVGFRLSRGPGRAEPGNRESGPAPGSARRGTRRREPGRGPDGR